MAQTVKNLPVMLKTWVQFLVATHSSVLACRIPWTEELSGLQSMGWQRVRHDWVTKTFPDLFWAKGILPVDYLWIQTASLLRISSLPTYSTNFRFTKPLNQFLNFSFSLLSLHTHTHTHTHTRPVSLENPE